MSGSAAAARILLVEDTPHNLELATYLLESAGHVVIAAMTGAAAIQSSTADRPDLVLLDLHLPDLDGHQVLLRLRDNPTLAGVPVVAVTASAMIGDRERLLAAGFDGYLAKPIEPTTFLATIASYLSAGRAAPTATDPTATDPTATDPIARRVAPWPPF